jgi:hypothetical protein
VRPSDPSRYASSGPPGTHSATAARVRSDGPVAVEIVRLGSPATRRVSRAERAHAWIGLLLVLGTTAISLYDTYLLASLAAT